MRKPEEKASEPREPQRSPEAAPKPEAAPAPQPIESDPEKLAAYQRGEITGPCWHLDAWGRPVYY